MIDDGSGIILDYLVYLESETEEWTACQVGDVIKINEKLVNYYGVFEAVSSKQQFITVVQDAVTPLSLTKVTSVEQYNGLVADLGDASKMHKPVPMELVVKGAPTDTKQRFTVEGVTGDAGTLALTKSGIEIKCVAGASYTIKGYMIGKGGNGYYNFFAISQESNDKVESVTIKGDSERTLKVNETLKLEYETTPAGAGNTVEWVSSNPTNVKVEDGVVTALVKGASETIKVVVDGHESNAITINVPNISVTALDISGELTTKEYNVGDALNVAGLKVTATFDDESTDDTYADKVEWVVNPATFTAEGEEVGVSVVAKLGEVESSAFAASVKVTVKPGSDKDHPLDADAAYDIGAKLANYGTSEEVYFVKGVVTGFYNEAEKGKTVPVLGSKSFQVDTTLDASFTEQVEKGAVIVASGKLFHISSAVTFTNKYESKVYYDDTNVALVEITGSAEATAGDLVQLEGKAYPVAAATDALVWESSDDTVATVDQTGKVTTKAAGKVVITATYGSGTDAVVGSLEITVAAAGVTSATAKYEAGTTTNMVEESNNAASIGLDPDVFSVTFTKGESSNAPGLNKNNYIALYSVRASGNGNTLIFEGTGVTITSIKITKDSTGSYDHLEVKNVKTGGEAIEGTISTDGLVAEYTIGASVFTLKNTFSGGSSNIQLHFTEIVIYYTVNA